MLRDVRLTLILTAVLGVPLFFAFAFLWNPHGSLGSATLSFIGLFGLLPYLYIASEFRAVLGVTAIPLAVVAQFFWTAGLVYCTLRLCRFLRYLTTAPQ